MAFFCLLGIFMIIFLDVKTTLEDLREKAVGAVITSLTALLLTWCRAESYKKEYDDISYMTRWIWYDDEWLSHDNKHSLLVTNRVDSSWKYDTTLNTKTCWWWHDMILFDMATWYDMRTYDISQRRFKYDIDDITKYDVTNMKYDVRITK